MAITDSATFCIYIVFSSFTFMIILSEVEKLRLRKYQLIILRTLLVLILFTIWYFTVPLFME